MFRTPLLLLAAFSVLLSTAAAYIMLQDRVTCQNQIIQGNSRRICATYATFGPALIRFPNQTVGYVGPYGYDFKFWKGLPNDTDTSSFTDAQYDQHLLDLTVCVSWENGSCQVKVQDTQCNSCRMCSQNAGGDTKLSADCANIKGGRNVTCESALIYLPLKKTKRNKKGKPPSSPPMGMMKGGSGMRMGP